MKNSSDTNWGRNCNLPICSTAPLPLCHHGPLEWPRFPDIVTMAQDGGKVVSLTHRPPLPPGNTTGNHFCQRLIRPQGHSTIGRVMSMKNSSDTNRGRNCNLPICSTAPLPLCHHGPLEWPRFPDFVTMTQDGGKVVSLTHRPPLPPGNTPDTHFCQRLSRPHGHGAIGRIMSMKNSNDTIWDRTSDLPICSTAP